MQYILFVILSFLIGTILFYLSNNICEPFTIGNDIQLSQNLNLTSKSPCECATGKLQTDGNGKIIDTKTIKHQVYKVTQDISIEEPFTNNGTLCIEPNAKLYIYSKFVNKGEIYNNGTITNIWFYGTITNSSGATITNESNLNNKGTINNEKGGTINNNYLLTNILDGNNRVATINNKGLINNNKLSFYNEGVYYGSGQIINNACVCGIIPAYVTNTNSGHVESCETGICQS